MKERKTHHWGIQLALKDFYSRVAMHQKTNEWAQRTSEFFYAWQQVNKNRSSIFHGVMFLFHTYWNFFLLEAVRLLPSSVKYYRSCLRLDERFIFSHSLSMYEIIMCPTQLQNCLSRYRSAPLCYKSALSFSSLPPSSWLLFKSGKKDLPPRLRC